ncbi:MAG: NACHT domain-containing protein [Nostocales cyanobacterium]|nr:MAG: NACHT domain-containing protein [Nostocales cyanobacterium]
MNLKENHIAKIDPLLEEALMNARGDEKMRVIMTLGDEHKLRNNQNVVNIKPADFPSPLAYRQALIEQRKNQISQVLGDTIQELQKLSLTMQGGTMSRVLVVEGSATDILRSLELSGVNHVSLDQLVGLPEIAPDEAVNHFAELYIKYIQNSGIELDEKTKKLIYQASKQYILNYQKRYNRLRVLGMSQPVNLDDIYTEVQCLQPDEIGKFESLIALEKNYRQNVSSRLTNEKSTRQDGIKIANEYQHLMILGQPGAGKSTFLRKIGLEALKGKSSKIAGEYIPVLIELKQFTTDKVDIYDILQQEFVSCNLPLAKEFTNQVLRQGQLLILLDGLDEVPNINFELVIDKIQEFVQHYKQNQFVISCRTAAYRHKFNKFKEFIIADFDDTQIQQFINNWFYSEVDKKLGTAQKCWHKINSEDATKELARTPLLLTFLCLEYDESQDLPKKRATLYSNALDILLRRWAAEKRLPNEPVYRQLGIDLEKIMLAEIAYHNFAADKLFFCQQDVLNQIQKFIASNDNAPKNLDAGKLLDAITIEQGILVERARDVYSFSHLTLQEYLTAQYIYDHGLVEKLVTEHLTDNRWKEVFLLIAGVMRGGADKLLLLMEKEAQKYINTPKLQGLLNWAEEVTVGSEGNYKPVGKRAVAIAYANFHANPNANSLIYPNGYNLALSIFNAYGIANIYNIPITLPITLPDSESINESLEYIEEVEKFKIYNKNINLTALLPELMIIKAANPDDKKSEKSHQYFAEKLTKTLLKFFNLKQEIVNLSAIEIKFLNNYIYANHLIIQCKDAALSVFSEIWEAIEGRMLLPPGS